MKSNSQPSTRPATEPPATQSQGTNGVIDLSDDEVKNIRPKESPAKDDVDGTNCTRPIAKWKQKENSGQDIEDVAPLRKKRKVDVAPGFTSINAESAVYRGAGSTQSDVRPELDEVIVLSSEEDARLTPRSRRNRQLNKTPAVLPVTETETSVDVLAKPADTNTSLHAPSDPNLPGANQVGKTQTTMSSPERTETYQSMATGGPVVSGTTSAPRGDQLPEVDQFPQGTCPSVTKKKCLALRIFDSQLERRRENGEAEKTRLLDALSWLSDLMLDPNKAEIKAEGIVFTGEVSILLSFEQL